jgi:hypothetical protein
MPVQSISRALVHESRATYMHGIDALFDGEVMHMSTTSPMCANQYPPTVDREYLKCEDCKPVVQSKRFDHPYPDPAASKDRDP